MCRWLAYSGGPIALSDLIFDTAHSIVDQSVAARSSVETTNGDGFGIGWYDELPTPGLYKHTQPAWNDENLRDVCRHTHSHMFLAHVRAATGTAIQRSNCHPFRHQNWLFAHNGVVDGAHRLRRAMAMELDDELFASVTGTTDSELMFYLALHFGLADDVYAGVSRMVGFVEALGRRSGIENPMQMTLGIADGARLYAFRYSSVRDSRTLFHSRDIADIRNLVPPERRARLESVTDDARTIVSEPFSDLPEMWQEIPESSFLTIDAGNTELRPFTPTPS